MNPIAEQICWPTAPEALPLGKDDIHIFAAPLDIAGDDLAKLKASLSADENERAARFKFERHRNRYIAGRGWLRTILGRFLKCEPAMLRFEYSAHGKPILLKGAAGHDLHFNLAHSEDLALATVTRLCPVGVDVERIRVVKDVEELVKRFFSARESEAFQKLSLNEQPAAFFNLWTRKEAMLKATGEGITGGLNRVEVSFLKGEPARVMAINGDTGKASEWMLRELAPAAGFVGAVAIQAANAEIQTWKMTNDQ